MAKSSRYHERDRAANQALKQILPTRWLFTSNQDVDSGKEYGIDLMVQLVNDDVERTVTGIKFAVQNKTKDRVSKGGKVSISLSMEDIDYLADQFQFPTMVHLHILENSTSYYLWFNDWYDEHRGMLSNSIKKSHTVRFREADRLTVQKVAEIEAYLRRYAEVAKLDRKLAYLLKSSNDQYRVKAIKTPDELVIEVAGRGPVSLRATNEADEEAARQAYAYSLDTGVPTPVSGNFEIVGIPQALQAFVPQSFDTVVFTPLNNYQPIYFDIQFVDQMQRVQHQSRLVKMECIQPGQKLTRWIGSEREGNVTYSILVDSEKKSIEIGIEFVSSASNRPQIIDEFYQVIEAVSRSEQLKFIHLESGEEFYAAFNEDLMNGLPRDLRMSRRLAAALATIERNTTLEIEIPRNFKFSDVELAELVAQAVVNRRGRVSVESLIPQGHDLFVKLSHEEAQHLVSLVHTGELHPISIKPTGSVFYNLLGRQIDLEIEYVVFERWQLLNIDEVEQQIAEARSEDEKIQAIVEIDREAAYATFIEEDSRVKVVTL